MSLLLILSPVLTALVAVLLARYSWRLLKQITKGREAYELYNSITATLEQLKTDSIRAKDDAPLSEHEELLTTAKIADVEKRLDLLNRYYEGNKNSVADIKRKVRILRKLLSAPSDVVPNVENRVTSIHKLVNDMMSELIEENYAYINKIRRWRG